MRRTLPALLVALLVSAGTGAAAPSVTEQEKACLDPVEATVCAAAQLTLDLPCTTREAGLVDCYPRITWRADAMDPLGVPASAEWFATALVEWCPPGDFCRGVGVAFRIETCNLGQQRACGGEGDYTINLSGMRSTPGQCYDVTWSGLAWMAVYVPNPSLSTDLFGGPALLADPQASVVENVCA